MIGFGELYFPSYLLKLTSPSMLDISKVGISPSDRTCSIPYSYSRGRQHIASQRAEKVGAKVNITEGGGWGFGLLEKL